MRDELKKIAAEAALAYVQSGDIVGIGTGSTVNYFIEALSRQKKRLEGVVASSVATEKKLRDAGIPIVDLNSISDLSVYIDGADEVDHHHRMIKGGGGALTREKIIASMAKQFICIVDESKLVKILGEFPVAVEVLSMARSYVAREIVKRGAQPVYRAGCVTDNGNVILDCYYSDLSDPLAVEDALNQLPGVVENGIFAHRLANKVLVGTPRGVLEV